MALVNLCKRWRVELTFTEPLLGTQPKNRQIRRDYLEQRALKRKELGAGVVTLERAEEVIAEEDASLPEDAEERGWTGFYTDDDGPFLYDYQIKGFFKEAGNILKDMEGVKVKALKSKLDDYLYVFPRRIRLEKLMDEVLERPLRAMTMQGPRVSLVASDQVPPGVRIEFEVWLLPLPALNGDLLATLLDLGQFKGMGQWRNGGYGRFQYAITPL